jgi:hypothetical protein
MRHRAQVRTWLQGVPTLPDAGTPGYFVIQEALFILLGLMVVAVLELFGLAEHDACAG